MRRWRTRRTGERLANWIIQWGEHKRRKQINGHFQGWICPCCWPLHSPCVEKQQGRRPRPVGTVVCGCEHWKGRRVGRRILGPPVCRYFTRLYKQHNINGWNNRSRIILYSQYCSECPLPPFSRTSNHHWSVVIYWNNYFWVRAASHVPCCC